VRWSPTANVARPPRVVFFSGDFEAACVWSGSGGFTLSNGVWCCSGTTAVGLAWRWPSSVRCSLFLSFPYHRGAVPNGGYMRWRRLLAAVARLRSTSIAQRSGLARVDVPIRPGSICLVETRCVACVDVPIRPA
jgi:hypothetical protein